MSGTYVSSSLAGERYRSFVPAPLPPHPPPPLDESDQDLIEKANRALGRLDGITGLLPDAALLIYFYVRKEAVLSSQIEGTQSSFSDLLLYESREAPGVPVEDVEEVSRYVAAMNHGLRRIRDEDFPISIRLLCEIHEILLSSGRGSDKAPGEIRRTQNWVGGSRPGNALFVPPPPDRVQECLGELELFLNDRPRRTPVLLKAALAHVQFETIHPFLDGNGRLGRLLITFLLCAEKALEEPLLYLSLYFREHRDTYYDLLQRVRTEGDWRAWIRFFLEGVRETAQQAFETAKAVLDRFEQDRESIRQLGTKATTMYRLHDLLRQHPIVSVPQASRQLELTAPTVRGAVEALERLEILREITGKQRDRVYMYEPYVRILDAGPGAKQGE